MNTDVMPGYKSYLAAAGLAGLALYQFSQGDYANAVQSLFAAVAIFGIRNAISRGK